MRIITIETETIRDFQDSWPCANLESVDHIVVAINGPDIVDIEFCGVDEEPIPQPLDSEHAVGVLIHDAATSATEVPLIVDGRRVGSTWTA